MSYVPLIYKEAGGNRLVVASGGSLDVESGGEIDIESSGSLKLAGTAITVTAAQINAFAAGTGTTGSVFTIDSDSTDAKLALNTNSATGDFTGTFVPPVSLGANRTWTMQDASGTIAFTTDTQTNLDLGSSGVAGSLDIFPTVVSNGKMTLTYTSPGGAYNLNITNRTLGQTTSLGIPDPGAAGEFVLTNSAHQLIVNCNSGDRTMSLSGNITIGGAFTTVGTFATAAGVAFTGANAVSFTTVGAYTYTLPAATGTLALATGAEDGTTSEVFTVDSDAGITTKLADDYRGCGFSGCRYCIDRESEYRLVSFKRDI